MFWLPGGPPPSSTPKGKQGDQPGLPFFVAGHGGSRASRRAIADSAIYLDVAARALVCVKPNPPSVPLFRMAGLRESEGCFCVEAGSEG